MARPASGRQSSSQLCAARSSVTYSTLRWNAVPTAPQTRPVGTASSSHCRTTHRAALASRLKSFKLLIETPDTKKLKILHSKITRPHGDVNPEPLQGGSHRDDNDKPLLPCAEEAGVLPNGFQKKEKGEQGEQISSRFQSGTTVEIVRSVTPHPAGRRSPLRRCGS